MIQTNILPARRNEIKDVVLKTLYHYGKYHIPVKIKDLVRSFSNIRLISYSKHMETLNISYNDVLKFTGTKDACTIYYVDNDLYIIYYNDIDKYKTTSNRYRWNIAHELGHIMLEHHKSSKKTRIFRSELSTFEYNELEDEADYFASLILVPHAALLGFKIKNANYIKIMCKISDKASKRRYYEFAEWKSHVDANDEYDNQIFHFYFNFVFKRKCRNCGAGLIQRYGKYCPICGSKNTLEWGDGNKMKYPLLQTLENGKLAECPNCHNEETYIEGDFCQICGRNIVNRCSNFDCSNNNILPSNARYCPICGCNSTFYNANFLKDWDYQEYKTSFDGYMDIPDGIEEELPFN